jgi:hypothetical protein
MCYTFGFWIQTPVIGAARTPHLLIRTPFLSWGRVIGGALPSNTTEHCISTAASTIAKAFGDYIRRVCTVQAVLHDSRRIVWTLTVLQLVADDRYQEIMLS